VKSSLVKNGSIKVSDLVKESKRIKPALSNGGEGDCVWTLAEGAMLGVSLPSYRKDRFGRVHLAGYAAFSDAPGGDADCDGADAGQISDRVAFVLKPGYIPATTIIGGTFTSVYLVIGTAGLTTPTGSVAPGSVFVFGGVEATLEGMSFDAARTPPSKVTTSGRITDEQLAVLGWGG
jgi:hypothetical protein